MRFRIKNMSLVLLLAVATTASAQGAREPVVGLPCEGCEAVFEGMPTRLESRARIAPKSEPGAPMIVVGRVLDANGRPRSGIVVYAYQTNREGIYPEAPAGGNREARRHGALRAWAKTGASGRYAFDTIRPGSYPGMDIPEHIHLHVIEPGCSTYYIDDIMFSDDPKLTPAQISGTGRGGNGIATPARRDGVWYVTRDIHLGRNIPGYRACGS